jgi:hypothetical protein
MDYFEDIFPLAGAAEDKLAAADEDMSRLPESVRVFLLVHGAQGVIDNGGYRYFFESDWPNTPPYEVFASAYETIGCVEQAADLRRVVATFPFPDPHLDSDKRQAFIDEHYDEDECEVRGWGEAICGDDVIWKKLAGYAKQHVHDFA